MEFRIEDGVVYWRYASESLWEIIHDYNHELDTPETNLDLEFQRDEDTLYWRQAGETAWHTAYELIDYRTEIEDARTPEFLLRLDTVLWRYYGDMSWQEAFDLTAYKAGILNQSDLEFQMQGDDLFWRYVGNEDWRRADYSTVPTEIIDDDSSKDSDEEPPKDLDDEPPLIESTWLSVIPDEDMIYANEYHHWYFSFTITNLSDEILVLQSLDSFAYTYQFEYLKTNTYTQQDFLSWWGTLTLAPNESVRLGGGLPSANDLYFEDYLFTARKLNQEEVHAAGRVYFSKEQQSDGRPDLGYNHGPGEPSPFDTIHLRHHADFEVYLEEDIVWVPVNRLGHSQLLYDDIVANQQDYVWFKENINTVYEIIQYLQYTAYQPSDCANQRIYENGYHWEHHEPAEITIMNHQGNCASMANMFVFALEGHYDEVGYIAWSMPDGGGHILNYVKHEGYYYVIDLTNYTLVSMSAGIEDGELRSYYNADFVSGNLHRVPSLEAYADYFYRMVVEVGNQPPVVFSSYVAHTNAAIDSKLIDGTMFIVMPKGIKDRFNIIFEDPNQTTFYMFAPGPTLYPEEWAPYYDAWWLLEE